MRRKTIALAATALVALAGCSGTVDRHDEAVQRDYVEHAREGQPELEPLSDRMLIDYGLSVCAAFDEGATVRELALVTGFAVQDKEIAGILGRLSATVTRELCPEHREVING